MRVIIVGREFSDYNREVREFKREFEDRTGVEVEEIDPDSPEGTSFCEARDIVQYPTVVVSDDDGSKVMAEFKGTPLPMLDEVAAYLG